MNNFDFDYVPIYKFNDPYIKLKIIGRAILWGTIPAVLVSLFLATQVNFHQPKWENSTLGIFFMVSCFLLFEILFIGFLFYFIGVDFNRAPIRLTLFSGELIFYFDKDIIKRYNLSQLVRLEPKIYNLNKSECKVLLIEYPKGKRSLIITQHVDDMYIERILNAREYYQSVT